MEPTPSLHNLFCPLELSEKKKDKVFTSMIKGLRQSPLEYAISANQAIYTKLFTEFWVTHHLKHQSKVNYANFEGNKGRKFKNPREIDPDTGKRRVMWSWELDNTTGETVIHCKTMHDLRVFDEHKFMGLCKEDILKLYNSTLPTVEDIGRQNTDRIVDAFNKFIRRLVEIPLPQDGILDIAISATGESEKSSSMISSHPCRLFSLAELQSATKNFDDELVIGKGGFGKVYKGQIYGEETDHAVAIKRLDSMSDQGELEFRAEIDMLSTLRHCHLVSLIGYCHENKEMILVYEYMPNGTLYHHLHKEDTPLSWMTRLKIAIGAARGLDYLHTGVGTQNGVIHRDMKSSNILLDKNWAAMISDFGLSRISPTNQSISFVEASVKGTFGYLDPEYFYTRKLTRKTDVYAFGVVLFELVSGRLPVDERYGEDKCNLVRWAQ
ncbi:putative serine/threonine-protein kinase PBL28, partial [Bidens hawaiensis]|uniref:putative serine/threonine-protein kinase PBL28 n=1 Tax=Bidens hawaiensis TaxID=980011 RepID=UPI00404983F8